MKKSKILLAVILPFLAFLGAFSVKAYDFNGINKVSRLDFGLYYDTTIVSDGQINCTTSNDGYCAFESSDLPTTSATYNNLRFVIRGTDNKSFSVGTQYKISWFFYQYTTGYFIAPGTISQVTGNTYQDFTSWNSNDVSIVSYSLIPLESSNNKTLYRVDVVFIPTSSTISGFNFRLYRDSKTISASDSSYMEFLRYLTISQIGSSSIDYTQDLNNINQSIDDLSSDISDSTQDIIDNQNQNAQDIINNQNANTQAIIDSNKSCRDVLTSIDKYSVNNAELNNLGSVISNNNWRISIYYELGSDSAIKVIGDFTDSNRYACFYDNNKVKISCITLKTYVVGDIIPIPTGAKFFRFSINKQQNKPKLLIRTCTNGNQAIADSITDDDVSGANSSAGNFFSSFQTDTYGLSSIITAPLTFIQSLTSESCSPLVLPLPFVNSNLSLPCMTEIYQSKFGSILTLYQTITFGIVSYWVIVRVFNLVKDFKNPDHDEVEVMDL